MSIKLIFASTLMAIGLAAPAMAAPGFSPAGYGPTGHAPSRGAWEEIGTREVSFRTERDVIVARGTERHRQLMVCVYRQPVRMLDLDVRYANGGHQDVGVRSIIGAGQCTRAIDLNGRHRDIREISLTYKTANGVRFDWRRGNRFGQTALVRVFAR